MKIGLCIQCGRVIKIGPYPGLIMGLFGLCGRGLCGRFIIGLLGRFGRCTIFGFCGLFGRFGRDTIGLWGRLMTGLLGRDILGLSCGLGDIGLLIVGRGMLIGLALRIPEGAIFPPPNLTLGIAGRAYEPTAPLTAAESGINGKAKTNISAKTLLMATV